MMHLLTITDGSVSAAILPGKGGTAVSLKKDGTEFLYHWEENLNSAERPRCGIPFLFPTFGRMQEETYHWNGSPYHMPIHGFAHISSWSVVSHTEDTLILSLTPDDSIRSMYPFPFRVLLTFRIANGSLEIQQAYENPGTAPIPYAFGFHPYFLLDKLENVTAEASARAQINFATGQMIPFGHGEITLAEPENALEVGAALSGLQSPVVLHIPKEHRRITMSFTPDFPQLVLWHPKEAPFLCAEPINGTPNGFNTGSYLTLDPGQTKTVTLTIHPEII